MFGEILKLIISKFTYPYPKCRPQKCAISKKYGQGRTAVSPGVAAAGMNLIENVYIIFQIPIRILIVVN